MRKRLFECPECRQVFYIDNVSLNSLLTCEKCGTRVALIVTPKPTEGELGLRITLTAVALLGALGGAMLINGWNILATGILIGGLIYLVEKVFKSKYHILLRAIETEQSVAVKESMVKACPERSERDGFEELVREVVEELPQQFRERLEDTIIVVEDVPDKAVVDKLSLPSNRMLSGLYQGVPLTRRSSLYGGVLPDKIIIYRKNIEASCKSRAEIKKTVQKVVRHEVAHHFGFSEKQIRKLGY
ncbi:MAG TPA: metallopeptidase family protein [Candidatus Brocadiales bacterium]|nr:metallopeptidase family protein [Candidatus Brocadiales bacterium]